jgi:hypothetical protein
MTPSSIDADGIQDLTANASSLRFNMHAFGVHCYNTVRCSVIYNQSDLSPSGAEDEPSPPPRSADYQDQWAQASYVGIGNFPAPAEVTWVSLDGVEHEARVDIGAIFSDQRIFCRIPDSEILEDSFNGAPDIFLEINDRTIKVYMRAFILTKAEQIPGNNFSTFRKDLILAWSHVY